MARRTLKAEAPVVYGDTAALVDRGYVLDQEIKAKEKELKAIKSKLTEIAQTTKQVILGGGVHSAVFSPNTKNTVNPLMFFDAMKAKKNLPGFFESITVGITKAKTVMNEFDLEKITVSETNEFGKISFK